MPRRSRFRAPHQHGLGLRMGSPKTPARRPQRRAGLDDVGDHVGDAELDGGLDGTVQPHDLGSHAVRSEVRPDEPVVAGGDAMPVDVGQLATPRPEPPRTGRWTGRSRAPISSAAGAGVEQQVAAGDADVERPRADVHGDVARTQEEELDVVVRVGQHELAGVAPEA